MDENIRKVLRISLMVLFAALLGCALLMPCLYTWVVTR